MMTCRILMNSMKMMMVQNKDMMMIRMRKIVLSLLAALTLAALPALADARTEGFVETNATSVLSALNDPDLSAADRSEAFNTFMNEFADMKLISGFVIGKYARRFSEDELARYRQAFSEYALTVYETELDKYRGESITVTGSTDRNPHDSIVDTIILDADGNETSIRWRVLNRHGAYQVVDVALNIDGNLVWLAIEQRAQFLALLDRTNGSADALISKLHEMTAELERKAEVELAEAD